MSNVVHGPSSVFDELGYSDAGEWQVKTRLAFTINDLLKGLKLKQREVAELLGVPQPKVSALKNYRLDQFSIEKLMEFLTSLNQDVEIMIRPHGNSAEAGQISVHAAQ